MNISKEEINNAFAHFEGKQVLILGDVMIDSYLRGKVDRISPEAPVPVVRLHKRENLLGGAANVALNVKSMGAVPLLCSLIGTDQRGNEFVELLRQDGISDKGILRSQDRITTIKFRIIGNNFQMLRVDEEMDTDLSQEEEELLIEHVTNLLDTEEISVIILQDYNKGILTRMVIERILEEAAHRGIPVTVDPKKKNFEVYKGVTLFKPNLKEMREGLKTDVDASDVQSLREAAIKLQQKQNIHSVMVTLSERGVYYRNQTEEAPAEVIVPAHLRNISDVSGAGDTVISVASLCVAIKSSAQLLVSLSNLAGGLVCEQVGVVPVDRLRLQKEALELLANE
jgi:rfaE bifunctional protein kinase chain/domain